MPLKTTTIATAMPVALCLNQVWMRHIEGRGRFHVTRAVQTVFSKGACATVTLLLLTPALSNHAEAQPCTHGQPSQGVS